MKVSTKTLLVAGLLVLVGFYVSKYMTEIPQKDLRVVLPKKWLVLGKEHKGGMKTQGFEDFFKECTKLRKQTGDTLPELTRYYVEPTEDNEKYTEVFSGVVVPDSSFTFPGYTLKEITIGRSVQVKHGVSAGLYPAIEEFSKVNQISLDASQVVEIIDGRKMTILMEIK